MSDFGLVPKKEKCAVWEIGPEYVGGTLLEIENGKTIRILESWQRRRGEKMPLEFREILRVGRVPVVVSLHPSLAFTSIAPFQMILKQGMRREEKLEFQSIIREIVNRSNLETRLLAAKALGVQDLDSVLFDARVTHLRQDGKEIAHFADLSGKRLDGTVHVMFTTRLVFQEFHELLHSRKELFVTEGGKASVSFLEKRMRPPLKILDLEPGREELAILDYKHDPVLKTMPFTSQGLPLEVLRTTWNLSEAAARAVYEEFAEGRVSKNVERFMKKLIAGSGEAFLKALDKTKTSGKIYARAPYALPFKLPYEHGKITLLGYPFEELFGELGFDLRNGDFGNQSTISTLLAFLEYYYYRGDPASHRALTRQIHWIAP